MNEDFDKDFRAIILDTSYNSSSINQLYSEIIEAYSNEFNMHNTKQMDVDSHTKIYYAVLNCINAIISRYSNVQYDLECIISRKNLITNAKKPVPKNKIARTMIEYIVSIRKESKKFLEQFIDAEIELDDFVDSMNRELEEIGLIKKDLKSISSRLTHLFDNIKKKDIIMEALNMILTPINGVENIGEVISSFKEKLSDPQSSYDNVNVLLEIAITNTKKKLSNLKEMQGHLNYTFGK